MKPSNRPHNPCFSSGPCAKRPGWSVELLKDAALGRSHRSAYGKAKLAEVIERSRALLDIPEGWRIGIVPASDTGAFEMALWSLLGAKGVDLLVWESFGRGWAKDVTDELRLPDARLLEAPYGALPDLHAVDFARDVVFVWNGTTSGVTLPDGEWIRREREGLTLCDATSGVFAARLPWEELDVVTYSWQKVLGGEAGQGMLVLSPRAVERLESYRPERPLPKIFRLTKKGALIEGIFRGETINTPSLLSVEDALDGLRWAEEIGGLEALIRRSRVNLETVAEWVGRTPWVDFLAREPAQRSSTSICLSITDPAFARLEAKKQRRVVGRLVDLLETEGVAYDIASYREAPPGLRLWGGATVERTDLEALFPWLDWAWNEIARGTGVSRR
ncbi:MAG: phosphoserine transaminase [Alphaproteobacteria bacterium]